MRADGYARIIGYAVLHKDITAVKDIPNMHVFGVGDGAGHSNGDSFACYCIVNDRATGVSVVAIRSNSTDFVQISMWYHVFMSSLFRC